MGRIKEATRISDTPLIVDGVDLNEIPARPYRTPIPFTHPIYRRLYPTTSSLDKLEKGQLLYRDAQYVLAVYTFYHTGEYPDHVLDPILETSKSRLIWAAITLERIPPERRWQVLHPGGRRREYPVPSKPNPKETLIEDDTPNNLYMGEHTINIDTQPVNTRRKHSQKLYVGNLYGQTKIWRNRYVPLIPKMDAIIGLGNYIRLHKFHTPPNESEKKTVQRVPRIHNQHILNDMRVATHYSTRPFPRLIGANEILYLNLPREEAAQYVPQDDVNNIDPIRDAWLTEPAKSKLLPEERLQVAVVVDGQLVTHAGLTYGEWVSIGAPADPVTVAERLNRKYAGTLYMGPAYMLGDGPRLDANPVFAHPQLETYVSWVMAPVRCPFDQVHGSSHMGNRLATEGRGSPVHPLSMVNDVVFTKYGSVTNIRGTLFTAVAPGVNSPVLEKDLGSNASPFISRTPPDFPGGLFVPEPVVTPGHILPNNEGVADPLQYPPEG